MEVEELSDPVKLTKVILCAILEPALLVAATRVVWCNREHWSGIILQAVGKVCALRRYFLEETEPIKQRVDELRRTRRVVRARGVTSVSVLVMLVFQTILSIKIFLGVDVDFADAAMVALQVFSGVAVVLGFFPQLIQEKTIDALFCLYILPIVLTIVLGRDTLDGSPDIRLWLATCGSCLFNLKPGMNALGVVMVAASMTAFNPSHAFVIWSTFLSLLVLLLWIDYSLTSSMRLEILAADSGNELDSVNKLLGTICDVVVELDSSLRLTRHPPKLSDLLLRGSGRSLQGAAIQDFMPEEEDRKKFAEHLTGADKASTHADVFHAKFIDSNKSLISMEFFTVVSTGKDCSRHHILGMREYTDIPPLAQFNGDLAKAQHAPPPPPAELTPRPRQDWPGTPAIMERENIGISAAVADPTSPSSSATGSTPGVHLEQITPRTETNDKVKTLSLAHTLMGWSIHDRGSCCSLHAHVASAQGILARMTQWACNHQFQPVGNWQCQRCGIMAKEFRGKGARGGRSGCLLCQGVECDSRGPATAAPGIVIL